jgi:hypothetical protein
MKKRPLESSIRLCKKLFLEIQTDQLGVDWEFIRAGVAHARSNHRVDAPDGRSVADVRVGARC